MKLIEKIHSYYLKQRFFPGLLSLIINPFYYSRKNLLKQIQSLAKDLDGKLLDFGCGSKPYKTLFSHIKEYIGIDVENEGHNHNTEDIDVFYDGKTIPFEDESFDSMLASEVLEHVPDIDESLNEMRRVLKKNGKILITVPFTWSEHELPFDFRRYTQNGIENVLKKKGFEVIVSKKSGNYTEVLVQLWMLYLHNLLYTGNKYINLIINAIFIFPSCLIGLFLSILLPKKNDLYFDMVILAKKLE